MYEKNSGTREFSPHWLNISHLPLDRFSELPNVMTTRQWISPISRLRMRQKFLELHRSPCETGIKRELFRRTAIPSTTIAYTGRIRSNFFCGGSKTQKTDATAARSTYPLCSKIKIHWRTPADFYFAPFTISRVLFALFFEKEMRYGHLSRSSIALGLEPPQSLNI